MTGLLEPCEGKLSCTVLRGGGDSDATSLPGLKGPRREWRKPKPMMNGLKKSDEAIRPVRAANKGARASAESPEERASTKGNSDRQSTRRTQCRASVPQAAARIRKAADAVCRQSPEVGAGWFNDHVRICAGGAQQYAFLPQLRGGGSPAMGIPTAISDMDMGLETT